MSLLGWIFMMCPKAGNYSPTPAPIRLARDVASETSRRFLVRTLLLIFFIAPISGAQSNTSIQSNEPKRVLILLQEDLTWPLFSEIYENSRDTLRAGQPGGILLFSEHMDRVHFPDLLIQAQRSSWIQRKYANTKLDLVIAVGEVPMDLFPGVPLLYLGINGQPKLHAQLASLTNASALWVNCDVLKTVELAKRLHPQAQQIFVIGGTSAAESPIVDQIRLQLASYSQMKVIYLTNLSFDEISRRVSTLGPESAILFASLGRDVDGRAFISADVASRISAISPAPVYVLVGTHLGSGTVGGYVTRFDEMGKQAGEMGLQMLAGGHPQDAVGRSSYIFDSRALQRFKLQESSLPVDSIILNRQPGLWESHKWYILAAILLCSLQAVLILGLLWQRSKKRIYQRSLLSQMAFEKMLSDLSTTFINLPEDQVGATIQKCLGQIAQFLKLDRITLFEYSQPGTELIVTFSWHAVEVPPVPVILNTETLSWLTHQVRSGGMIAVSDVDTLPPEASEEREHFRKLGTLSFAALSLNAGDQSLGCISFASTTRRVVWKRELVDQLQLLAEIFSNALGRKRSQETRLRHTAIVQSSDDAIIAKDLQGIVLSWNAGAQHIFEYTPEEIIGHSIELLIPPELYDEQKKILQDVSAGVHVEHYETVRITKSGKRIHVSLTISPVRDSAGVIVGAAKIARNITDRKRAEQVLSESEERFRLVANNAPVLIWMSGTNKLVNFVNQSWLNFTGRTLEQELGDGWAASVHPDDLDRCLITYSSAFNEHVDFEMEYRLRRHDGAYRWIVDFGVPRFARDAIFCGYIGTCVDITERKASEESLHTLSGRLIRAQEEERARIARELHDDFSQRLAILGIGLGQLWKRMPESDVEERAKILEMLKCTKEISSDIHSLSHQLHSSKLEHVGLRPALAGLCKEIGDKYKIDILFADCGFPADIPKDAALCLFRVAQESLSNIVKHSQTVFAKVALRADELGITLRISDFGKGFDLNVQNPHSGIGLISMSERLRLVGGKLVVNSALRQGTEILAEVPLAVPVKQASKLQAAGV
jgi:PAS domain S-box-containing protein